MVVAFASELGRHWGSDPVQVPLKVVRPRSFSANAERALRALGFEVEVIP